MTKLTRDSTAGTGSRVIRSLPALSFVFVVVALLALTVIPLLTTYRLQALRSSSDSGLVVPARIIRELRNLFGDETIELQAYQLTGDRNALGRYRRIRARQDVLIDELRPFAENAGADAQASLREFRELKDRWHALQDAWLARKIGYAQYGARLPAALVVRDSLVALADLAEPGIEREIASVEAAGLQVVVSQQTLALSLGGLALVAAIIVGWTAVRERRLTHELGLAVQQEASARQVAERSRAELQAVTDSKARLTRGFSHDVKNPLGAADGYLQLLEVGVPQPVTAAQQQYVEKARRSLSAALNLIEDLLEIERASTGQIRIESVRTDLGEVVREAVEEYRAHADAKRLRFELDIAAGVPAVFTDPARVRQVLGNLISNAVKYTPAGHVLVRLDHRVDSEKPEAGERIAIDVTDAEH